MAEELEPISRLVELEAVINRGLKTFVEVGAALIEISRDRLYRAEFNTFDDYVKKRWSWSRDRAYQLMDAARVVDVLPTTVGIPSSERQARELVPILKERGPEAVREVWRQVQEDHGPEATAREIHAVVAARSPIKHSLSDAEWGRSLNPGAPKLPPSAVSKPWDVLRNIENPADGRRILDSPLREMYERMPPWMRAEVDGVVPKLAGWLNDFISSKEQPKP